MPFFPDTSYAFAFNQPTDPKVEKTEEVKKIESKGIVEARKKWISGEYNKGDGEDPAIQNLFKRNLLRILNSKNSPGKFTVISSTPAQLSTKRINEGQSDI